MSQGWFIILVSIFMYLLGIVAGACIWMDTSSPITIQTPPTTVEVWGVGYQQGFNDSRILCEQVLHNQQEMMLEYLEQHPQPDRSNSVRGGTDRDGATISGLRGTKVPKITDREGQQQGHTGDASDWHSGPIRIS